jgi:hypothetical protein
VPVVLYKKTAHAEAVWVQTRRIRCELCGERFAYLLSGARRAEASGLWIVNSTEGLKEAANHALLLELAQLVHVPREGEARCPHCRCYQRWMVTQSHVFRIGKGFFVGGFLGVILGIVLVFVSGSGYAFPAMAAAGAIVGSVIGWKTALKAGRHESDDPRAMTLRDFDQFVADCEARGVGPPLAWYTRIGGKLDERTSVIPLPPYEEP